MALAMRGSRLVPATRGPAPVALAPARSRPCQMARRLVAPVRAAQKVADLPPSLRKIVTAFQMVPDPMARYKQLLFYATKLEKLPAELQTKENKVEGCVSQVWVVPELRPDGLIYWRADSDSQLTKGLAALLVNGLSGCTAQEIASVQPEFIEMLGLKQSLTPSRNNGFLNMLKLMQRKALELMAASQGGNGNGSHTSEASSATATPTDAAEAHSSAASQATSSSPAAASTSSHGGGNGSVSTSKTPIQESMRRKITEAFQPARLSIEDNSAQHAGHAAMRAVAGKAGGSSGETHFRVEIVSDAFEGKTLVQRHRAVNQLLADEFTQGLHALSLDTKTPTEAKL